MPDRGNPPLERLVVAAQGGDGVSLERLVLSIRGQVYRLSLRMTGCPQDAEDATQDVLIRVITRLSGYRGDAAFTTWVHRVTVNYLLDRAKSPVERMELTFERFGEDLLVGLSAGPSAAPDAPLLERELQLACTHAVLTCLDREARIAYILGDVIGVDSDEGGYICDVPPATYRKRLSRARQRVQRHLAAHCGLVDSAAPCRCDKQVDGAVASGRISRDELRFVDAAAPTEQQISVANDRIAHLYEAGSLLRSLPPAAVPERTGERITALLADSGLT
ncbi:MAG: sigma-70 family RNA polymerase sigma factor [Solirubrobacteraceae bacterium]|nr:sigma-70 family RNA polymerase sigma factor [Solirubrobacteraceae bacterium]